ncbi:MAG: hypothetical protein OXJ37_02475 [Bryobacterales bacterium]|nr:hypothetical protein [Bryobacterales bacterium]
METPASFAAARGVTSEDLRAMIVNMVDENSEAGRHSVVPSERSGSRFPDAASVAAY